MENQSLTEARILVVDDEPANVLLMEQILQESGYTNIQTTTDPRQVLPLCRQSLPDLILLDLHMPEQDGFTVMRQLVPVIPYGTYLPILVLTADITPIAKKRALAEGAKDFLTKPFDIPEVLLRIRNLLLTRALHVELQLQNQTLEERVRQRTQDLEAAQAAVLEQAHSVEESQIEILERLARACEFRDDDTGKHTQRVSHNSALLAREMALAADQIELLRQAAPLHDVGKIGVPDEVLLKPGKLTREEFETIKAHTTIGASLLAGGRSELVQMAERIALTHHERWDGSGYPRGIRGDAIPVAGRIVAVVDVFDALTHERPYKKAWPVKETLAEIRNQIGRHFCPAVAEAFLRLPHHTLV